MPSRSTFMFEPPASACALCHTGHPATVSARAPCAARTLSGAGRVRCGCESAVSRKGLTASPRVIILTTSFAGYSRRVCTRPSPITLLPLSLNTSVPLRPRAVCGPSLPTLYTPGLSTSWAPPVRGLSPACAGLLSPSVTLASCGSCGRRLPIYLCRRT